MRTSTLLVLFVLLAACGGSGGGGPAPQNALLFSGEYRLLTAGFRVGAGSGGGGGGVLPRTPGPLMPAATLPSYALVGTSTADGAGGAQTAGLLNLFGTVATLDPANDTYRVEPGNRFFLGDRSRGGISRDGRVVGTVGEGATSLLLRAEADVTPASLAGSYRFALLMDAVGGPQVLSFVGVCTLDDVGSATLAYEASNAEGALFPSADEVGTYTIEPDGSVVIDFGVLAFRGSLGYDGRMLVLGGGSRAGESPALLAMIRRTSGADASLLSGAYFAIGQEFRVGLVAGDPGNATYLGEVIADGAAFADLSYEERTVDAEARTPVPQLGSFTIAADGRLDVSWDFQSLRGAVTADGEVAILGGGVDEGDRPAFIVLIRK